MRIERLYPLADEIFRRNLNSGVDSVRQNNPLYGHSYPGDRRSPYESPASGTTATAIPDSTGRFVEPVYYDWGSNWDRVSELVQSQEVQTILMQCVNKVSDGYYFKHWDERTIWPFLFVSHRRCGNEATEALLYKYLTPLQLRELQNFAADRLKIEGESHLFLNDDQKHIAAELALMELKSGEQLDEDALKEEMDYMIGECYDRVDNGVDESVSNQITEAAESILYTKNGPGSVRDVLLCTVERSHYFMPLNYILAKLVSPDDANLKVCVGSGYSVVFDEERNIVFDNDWYFHGIPASEALEKSRRDPIHPSRFDYSLGGIAN